MISAPWSPSLSFFPSHVQAQVHCYSFPLCFHILIKANFFFFSSNFSLSFSLPQQLICISSLESLEFSFQELYFSAAAASICLAWMSSKWERERESECKSRKLFASTFAAAAARRSLCQKLFWDRDRADLLTRFHISSSRKSCLQRLLNITEQISPATAFHHRFSHSPKKRRRRREKLNKCLSSSSFSRLGRSTQLEQDCFCLSVCLTMLLQSAFSYMKKSCCLIETEMSFFAVYWRRKNSCKTSKA